MATILEITHDSSTTLSDFYNTIDDNESILAVNGTAALNGSTYGVECDYDAGAVWDALIQQTFVAVSTGQFRFRIYVDFTNIPTVAASAIFFSSYIQNGSAEVFAQIQLTTTVGGGL